MKKVATLVYIVYVKTPENNWQKKGNKIMIKKYDSSEGQYKVINGSEIVKIKGSKSKHFWKFGKYTREKYLDFIKASQVFFKDYNGGKDCSNYQIGNADALSVYEHCGNCVEVYKTKDGYICRDDGRHRCAAAKELGLDLLVCIKNQ